MSIILLLLIGSFAAYEFYQMVTKSNPAISQLSLIRTLDDESEFRPYESTFGEKTGGFYFAFGAAK